MSQSPRSSRRCAIPFPPKHRSSSATAGAWPCRSGFMGRVLLQGTTCVSPLARAPAWVMGCGTCGSARGGICSHSPTWEQLHRKKTRSNNHGSRIGACCCSFRRIRARRALRDRWRWPFQGLLGSGISRPYGGLLLSTSLVPTVCIPTVPVPWVAMNVQHGLSNGCKAGLGWRVLSKALRIHLDSQGRTA